ncbi:cytochrome P450 [Cladochytrium replicatum]|nr:cytochrome P450 [Cladochytrium replicatum]
MDYFSAIFIACLAVLLVVLLDPLGRNSTSANQIKKPYKLPILGHLYLLTDLNLHLVFAKLADKYGDVLRLDLIGKSWAVISGPDQVKRSTADRRSLIYSARNVPPFYRDHLLLNGHAGFLYAADWKTRRRAIQPLLSPSAVKDINGLLMDEVGKFISAMKTKANGNKFNPATIIRTFPPSVMISVLFRRSYNTTDARFLELLAWVQNINDATYWGQLSSVVPIIEYLPLPAWKIIREWVPRRDAWIRREMEELQARMNSSDPKEALAARESFFGKLIAENHDWLIEDMLIMFAQDLLFAGTDTTATAIVEMFCFMANHPSVLQKIQQEIDDKVPTPRLPNMQDETSLIYTNAVINELLRLGPPAPLNPRSAAEDDVFDGVFIPKGSHVWFNIWRIHRHPQYWSEPIDAFDPDRFLRFAETEKNNENGEVLKDNPANLFPFGFGRRSCPGSTLARHELFLAITHIAYHFNIRKPDGVGWIADSGNLGITFIPAPFEIVLTERTERRSELEK